MPDRNSDQHPIKTVESALAVGKNKSVWVQDLGLKDYAETWDYQEKLFQGIVQAKINNRRSDEHSLTENYFLLVRHPHVYTLGKSGDASNLLIDEKKLAEIGAQFFKINRGGDITYHGPGQIIGYPILDLENFFTDIHKYLRLLEEMIILTLEDYGINLIEENNLIVVDTMKWNGEAKKSGIEMGDFISEFKIENENRPNKNFVYPIAFLILIIAGTYNIKKKQNN